MTRGAEPGHVPTGLGGGLPDAGDGHKPFKLVGERAHLGLDPLGEFLERGGQLVDAR